MKNTKYAIYAGGLLTLLMLTTTAVRAVDAAGTNATAGAASPGAPLVLPSRTAWPDKIFPVVDYDNVPLAQVVKQLRNIYDGKFDMVLPSHWDGGGENILPKDWLATPITLRLVNVTAPEVFTAMNMYFDVNETPLHWELTANGDRPVAVLHVTVPPIPPGAADPKGRCVYFVGNLIGDGKINGMTMDQVVDTLSAVYEMSFKEPASEVMQAHKEAQLIVVTGTEVQIGFMENALRALNQKVSLERAQNTPAAPAASAQSAPVGAAKSP